MSDNTSGKPYEFYELKWDTDYFNVSAAKFILKEGLSGSYKNRVNELASKYEFITLQNPNNLDTTNEWILNNTSAFLVDTNIQFIKQVENRVNDTGIEIQNNYGHDDKLLSIARTNFLYSRFFCDKYLKPNKAKEIYVEWTKNAFNREDKYFIVDKTNNQIRGYILCSIDHSSNSIIIELIVVDKLYQGQKIGFRLLQKLEAYALELGITYIKVGTQMNNINARKFYSNYGFSESVITSTYHWWPNKFK